MRKSGHQSSPVTITPVNIHVVLLPKQKPACPDLTFGHCFFIIVPFWNNKKKTSALFLNFHQILYIYWFLFIGCFIRKSIFKPWTWFFYATHGQYLLSSQSIIAFSRCKHYCVALFTCKWAAKQKCIWLVCTLNRISRDMIRGQFWCN